MKTFAGLALLSGAGIVLFGCGSTTAERYSRDAMAEVGKYDPPPPGFRRDVRVAVAPKFIDKTGAGVGEEAAAQLNTLVHLTGRFRLVEREALEALLKEQGLEGIVDPSELARSGKIRGVDYLFIGKVTNFRIKATKEKTGFGLGRITRRLAGVSFDSSKIVVKTDVGVDVKLVSTTTGEIAAAHFGEVSREDVASAWGMNILGIGGEAENNVRIDRDSQGKVLRWALDEVLKKMLPQIDAHFTREAAVLCPKCKAQVEAGAKFCPKCGASVAPPTCKKCGREVEFGAKFCPACGTKIEGQ